MSGVRSKQCGEVIKNWNVLNNWEEGFKELYTLKNDYWGMGSLDQEDLENLPKCSEIARQIYMKIHNHCISDKCPALLEKLASKSPEELVSIEQNTDFLLKNHAKPEFIPILVELLPLITEASNKITGKNESLPSVHFLQKIVDIANQGGIDLLDKCLKGNPKSILANLTILKQGLKTTKNCQNFRDLYNDLESFRHVFSELMDTPGFTQNCVQHILPRIENGNSIFGLHDNKWGAIYGEKGIAAGVGIATFFYKCYATPINPRGINDLLQMSQETLAGNLAKHEQIRADAYYLEKIWNRDPIHDSSPGIEKCIGAMITYYDNPNEENKIRLQKHMFWGDSIFDLKNYELITTSNEKIIDILRRIYSNMSQNNMELPITENTQLNKLAAKANQFETPTMAQISPLVKKINQILLQAIDAQQVGLSPETVELLAWTDKKLALALNAMDFEKQSGFYKTDECREVLLFSDLTHSAKETYNLKEFNQFYEDNIKNAFDMEQAYQNIGQRQNKNLFDLFKQYAEDCHAMNDTLCAKRMTEIRKERAGSGNTLKALQNLTLYKEASTKIGQKHLAERHQRAPYRDIYLKLYERAKK